MRVAAVALAAASLRAPAPLGARNAILLAVESASAIGAWLDSVYDRLDYEAILLTDTQDEDDVDDSVPELTYGESDLGFFLSVLDRALVAASACDGGPTAGGRSDGLPPRRRPAAVSARPTASTGLACLPMCPLSSPFRLSRPAIGAGTAAITT